MAGLWEGIGEPSSLFELRILVLLYIALMMQRRMPLAWKKNDASDEKNRGALSGDKKPSESKRMSTRSRHDQKSRIRGVEPRADEKLNR